MNSLSKLFLLAATIATYGSITANSSYGYSRAPVPVKVPEDSNKSCEEAINAVEAELAEKGFFVPWEHKFGERSVSFSPKLTISRDEIGRSYYNYPQNRPHSITFFLSGEASRVESLLGSPQLMAIYSAQIMSDCYQIGLINFNHWWEGYIPVGYFPNDTAKMFTYINRSPRDFEGPAVYQWGTYYSH